MSKTPFTDAIRKKTRRELNTQFNNLIKTVLADLPSQSPQYSGFFASSWQANTYRPLSNEKIRSPWTERKKDRDKGITTTAIVEPRYYPPKRKFKFGETVFIGNRAEYARQALGSQNSSIMPYLENITQVVEVVFSDTIRQPDIRVAETQVMREGVEGGRTAPALGSRYKKL